MARMNTMTKATFEPQRARALYEAAQEAKEDARKATERAEAAMAEAAAYLQEFDGEGEWADDLGMTHVARVRQQRRVVWNHTEMWEKWSDKVDIFSHKVDNKKVEALGKTNPNLLRTLAVHSEIKLSRPWVEASIVEPS
jgi:hypothetical protein